MHGTRGAKSFLAEGLWKNVYGSFRREIMFFIQFGHNDAKNEDRQGSPHRVLILKTTSRNFIFEARNKSAVPILLTPVREEGLRHTRSIYRFRMAISGSSGRAASRKSTCATD